MKEKGGAEVEKVVSPAIAGPGFINIRVNRAWTARHIQAMLRDVRAPIQTWSMLSRALIDHAQVAAVVHAGSGIMLG